MESDMPTVITWLILNLRPGLFLLLSKHFALQHFVYSRHFFSWPQLRFSTSSLIGH